MTVAWITTQTLLACGPGVPVDAIRAELRGEKLATASPSPSASASAAGEAPKLVSAAPTSGITRGGTTVTLGGSGFAASLSASFGGSVCESVSIASSTQATCRTSAHASGLVAITIANGAVPSSLPTSGLTAALESAFRYLTPATIEVRPSGTPSPVATVRFSDQSAWSTGSAYFQLANSGEASASAITVTGISAPFSYASGAYPGGGSCGSALDGARDCSISMAPGPTLIASFGTTVTITYADDGGATPNATTTARLELSSFGAVAVAAGTSHSCALLSTGRVLCWGSGTSGQLGLSDNRSTGVPTEVSEISTATQIAAYSNGTCALLADSTVRCWGGGTTSRLFGDNLARDNSPTPVQASGITTARQVCVGLAHACALLADGSVRCWGTNGNGELGDNSATHRGVPVQVSGLSGAIDVACGSSHSCAASSGGQSYCWGQDAFGQLGDGGSLPGTGHARPVPVSGLTDVTRVFGGGGVSCAAKSGGGSAYCWGDDINGVLGNDTSTTNQSAPVLVSGLSAVSKLAGAGNQNCALASGVVRCWGRNAYGHIGDNNVAVAIGGALGVPSASSMTGTDLIDIAVSDEHVCALERDGRAYCWGNNSNGELGTNTTTSYAVPVRVSGF